MAFVRIETAKLKRVFVLDPIRHALIDRPVTLSLTTRLNRQIDNRPSNYSINYSNFKDTQRNFFVRRLLDTGWTISAQKIEDISDEERQKKYKKKTQKNTMRCSIVRPNFIKKGWREGTAYTRTHGRSICHWISSAGSEIPEYFHTTVRGITRLQYERQCHPHWPIHNLCIHRRWSTTRTSSSSSTYSLICIQPRQTLRQLDSTHFYQKINTKVHKFKTVRVRAITTR